MKNLLEQVRTMLCTLLNVIKTIPKRAPAYAVVRVRD